MKLHTWDGDGAAHTGKGWSCTHGKGMKLHTWERDKAACMGKDRAAHMGTG